MGNNVQTVTVQPEFQKIREETLVIIMKNFFNISMMEGRPHQKLNRIKMK